MRTLVFDLKTFNSKGERACLELNKPTRLTQARGSHLLSRVGRSPKRHSWISSALRSDALACNLDVVVVHCFIIDGTVGEYLA